MGRRREAKAGESVVDIVTLQLLSLAAATEAPPVPSAWEPRPPVGAVQMLSGQGSLGRCPPSPQEVTSTLAGREATDRAQ